MTSRISLGVQVALGRGLTAERVGLVGEADVQGVPVEIGVHRHRGDAQLLAGTDDPDGDLAPVGDEDLREHGPLSRRSPVPVVKPEPERTGFGYGSGRWATDLVTKTGVNGFWLWIWSLGNQSCNENWGGPGLP